MLWTSALPLAMACVEQSGMHPVGSPNDPTSTTTTTSGVMWRANGTDREASAERMLREEEETAERQKRWAEQGATQAGPEAPAGTTDGLAKPEDRAAFEQKLRVQLETIDREIDDLRARADASPATTRAKAGPRLREIATKRAQLEQSAKRLQQAIGAEWQKASVDAQALLEGVKREIAGVRGEL